MNRTPTQPYTPTQIEPNLPQPNKKPIGYIVGMVVCSLLAIAGIAFGAYGLISSNNKDSEITALSTKVSDQSSQISSLESELAELQTPTTDTDLTESATTSNPLIISTSEKLFRPYYQSPKQYTDGYTPDYATISLQEGEIASCNTYHDNAITNDNCTISGLSGPVYKVVSVGEGQNNFEEIAFIMQDGTVQYINLSDLIDDGNATVQGTYPIDGFVIDVVETNVLFTDSPTGGYGTSLFILSDGTQIPYGDLNK